MSEPSDRDELMRRIERELIDGLDEEFELEVEDRPGAALVAEGLASAPGDADRSARLAYFRELFRLQGELVKLQDWVAHARRKIVILFEGRATPLARVG